MSLIYIYNYHNICTLFAVSSVVNICMCRLVHYINVCVWFTWINAKKLWKRPIPSRHLTWTYYMFAFLRRTTQLWPFQSLQHANQFSVVFKYVFNAVLSLNSISNLIKHIYRRDWLQEDLHYTCILCLLYVEDYHNRAMDILIPAVVAVDSPEIRDGGSLSSLIASCY